MNIHHSLHIHHRFGDVSTTDFEEIGSEEMGVEGDSAARSRKEEAIGGGGGSGDVRVEVVVDASVLALDVEAWVDRDPQVEVWMRRVKDGLVLVFAPTKESYARLVSQGVVAFTPREVQQILGGVQEAGADPEKRAALRELLDKVVEVKRAMPGAKLGELHGEKAE